MVKHSRQREALLELLKSTDTHPTAEWLYMHLKREFPKISLATVYRNLAQLCESGDALKLDLGDSVDHYDGCTSKHYHFICGRCGRVFDLDMEPVKALEEDAGKCSKHRITSYSLVFFGECEKCAQYAQ